MSHPRGGDIRDTLKEEVACYGWWMYTEQRSLAQCAQKPVLWHQLLKEEKAFICESTGKDTGVKAHIVSLVQGQGRF